MAEMSWGEIKETGTGGGTDYMKLESGANQVRIVSAPYSIDQHWEENTTGGKTKVICPGAGCPICQAGKIPQRRYQVQVLDRKDGSKLKVLEGGPRIFNAIKAFAEDEEYGNPTTYDMRIIKEGSGRETKYSVVPSPTKKPLTDEEKSAVESAKKLSEINKVKPVEEIMQLNLKILGENADLGDSWGSSAGNDTKSVSNDDWDSL